jgi:hypothetical protein
MKIETRIVQLQILSKKIGYIFKFNELEKYFEKADFTDVKVL